MKNNNDWLDRLAQLRDTMAPDSEPEAEAPADENTPSASEQTARLDIVYERKGRAGKPATIVTGFTLDDEAVADIASEMKKALATGGSARGGEILLQGDRRREALAFLNRKGYKARII